MRILVCLDGSDFSAAVIPAVRELVGELDHPQVELLRVLEPRELEGDPGGGPVESGEDLVEASGINPTERMRAERERSARLDEERARYRERLRAQRSEEEREALRSATGDLGVQAEATVLFDADVAGAIVAHARTSHASLIAMATHSRAPVRELLLGSVAEAVLRAGAAPVLLVHPSRAR